MKILFLLLVVRLAFAAIDEFDAYRKSFNKTYREAEIPFRRDTFFSNLRRIEDHNSNPAATYRMGLNQFSDLTAEEFRLQMCGKSSNYEADNRCGSTSAPYCTYGPSSTRTVPDSWDWRNQINVPSVQDQGQCGVCWAFASTASVESGYTIGYGSVLKLSESQQAACNPSGGCDECAFNYLLTDMSSQAKGACLESDFPYTCPQDSCNVGCSPYVSLDSYVVVPQLDEKTMAAALLSGPIAIGISATDDFQYYSSGVFTGSCSGGVDHAVLIVGYGHDNGLDYWTIRNSWSANWGEKGYMRLQRGINLCQVASDPAIPHVEPSGCPSGNYSVEQDMRGACSTQGLLPPDQSEAGAQVLCSMTTGCVGYTFDTSSANTWLCFENGFSTSSATGWSSGRCKGSTSCPSGRFVVTYDRRGTCSTQGYWATTQVEAQQICLNEPNCTGYTWSHETKNVYLCDKGFSSNPSYGWDSGTCV